MTRDDAKTRSKPRLFQFQVWHPDDPTCTVDLFIPNPIDFNDLWARSSRANLGANSPHFSHRSWMMAKGFAPVARREE